MKILGIQIADSTFKAIKLLAVKKGLTMKELLTTAIEQLIKKDKQNEN